MKILYISSDFFRYTGNHVRAFYAAIKKYVGDDNVVPFLFPSRGRKEEELFDGYVIKDQYNNIDKVKNTIFRGDPLVGKNVVNELIFLLENEKFDIVFLSRSTLGCLIETIRAHTSAKIVSYNPDVLPDAIKGKWNADKIQFLKFCIPYLMSLQSDKIAANNADVHIVLNERDREGFVKYYKQEPDLILPLFCIDKLKFQDINEDIDENKFILLFVGSYFWPNLEGIKWFIDNVMPSMPDHVELQIIGNKMQDLKDEPIFRQRGVNLIGTVEATEPYYLKADLVVAPIFSGTGMKNKIAEALMYGKEFLAAPEALTGYIGFDDKECKTAEEFIKKIRIYLNKRPKKFNPELRTVFEERYSVEAISNTLGKLFEKVLGE